MLQPTPNDENNAAFTFEAAFLTAYHLYAFYKRPSEGGRVHLGRFCRFSHTWQAVDSFPALPPNSSHRPYLTNERLHALPLPWAQGAIGREVMLFYGNQCVLLTLEAHPEPSNAAAFAPVGAKLEQLSLRSMLSLPEREGLAEIVINVEPADISTYWLQVVAEPERRAVYALAQLAVGNNRPELGIFRLDVATRQWTRLTLVEDRRPRGHRLTAGHFMALFDGHLYIGQVSAGMVQTPQGSLDDDESLALEEVVRFFFMLMEMEEAFLLKMLVFFFFPLQLVINLQSLVVVRRPVTGELPSLATANLQVNLQFAQVGDTVYALSALFGLLPNDPTDRLGVVKNQLWALHLPSLTMQHINDGPQGGLLSGHSGKSSTEKIFTFPPFTSSFSPEDYFMPCPFPPVADPDPGADEDRDNDFISNYEPLWPALSNRSIVVASPMLMTNYVLVADSCGGANSELWALSLNQVLCPSQLKPPPLSRFYRVVLGPEVPSLASMALRSMLTSRRPVRGLLVTHSNDLIRSGPVPQQERTLSYLRAFVQRTPHLGAFIAKRHLPDEERMEVVAQLLLQLQEARAKLDNVERLLLQMQRAGE